MVLDKGVSDDITRILYSIFKTVYRRIDSTSRKEEFPLKII